MLDTLGSKFSNVFNKLRGYGKLTEANLDQALREVRLALLEADVHVGVAKSFLENVKQKVLGQKVLENLNPYQQFLNIIHEELIVVLGGVQEPLSFSGKSPHVLMMVGLQGSGKTTSAAKLALFLKKKGRNPYLIPADINRPAAIDQLIVLAEKVGIPCFQAKGYGDVLSLVKEGLAQAQKNHHDIVLVDTAGRLQIDTALMGELKKLHESFENKKVLFVADAMTGQEAVKVAKSFDDLLKIDGVILTKLDGDARGGAVFSIRYVLGCPVYFAGIGEKVEDFEPFYPDRLASKLLDRGDLLSLVEKAKGIIDENQALEFQKKLKINDFTLEDFKSQLGQMKKLGSLQSLVGYLPGMKRLGGKVDFNQAEHQLKVKEAILNSMTAKERLRPEILNGSRRLRIAKGSGTHVSDVNRLLQEFTQMKKMMKMVKKGGLGGLKNLMGL
ncbi:MAG TPA: signal recognition particle protein [Deltaproteobacteria bacterium]|nr:MAG: signal recognition particle protein [Deltaproteobacteria bacterium GWA2_45_12]HBF12380.1 signal recognition particle protein [Deltaproteobacteria bacterium]